MSKLTKDFFNILTLFEKTGKLLSLKQFQNLPEEVERRQQEEVQEKAIKNQIATIKKNAKSRKTDFLGLLPHQIDPANCHKSELDFTLPHPPADAPPMYHCSPSYWGSSGIDTYWSLFFRYHCHENHEQSFSYLRKILLVAENFFYGDWLQTQPQDGRDWQKQLKQLGITEYTSANYYRSLFHFDTIKQTCIAAFACNRPELAIYFAKAWPTNIKKYLYDQPINRNQYILIRYIADGVLIHEFDELISTAKPKEVHRSWAVLQAIDHGEQQEFEESMFAYLTHVKRTCRVDGGPWESLSGALFYYLAKQKGLTIPDAVEKSPYIVTDYWLTKLPEGGGK